MTRLARGRDQPVVRDLTTGTTLFARNPASARIPASVEKLYTTAAALRLRGDRRAHRDARARDRRGPRRPAAKATCYLVGSGDPTLDLAAIRRLARAVERAGIRRVSGSVIGDESRFDALRGGPRTGGLYDRDMGGVLGALTVGPRLLAPQGRPGARRRPRAGALAAGGDGVRVHGPHRASASRRRAPAPSPDRARRGCASCCA